MNYFVRFVTLVPLWVAPNLITIVGLLINIVTSLLVILYCPTATEPAPWWTTALCAVGLFLYQTLGTGRIISNVRQELDSLLKGQIHCTTGSDTSIKIQIL